MYKQTPSCCLLSSHTRVLQGASVHLRSSRADHLLFTETPPTPHCGSSSSLPDADGGERMSEGGAVPSQDGAGRGSDGEGLAASPHEEPQSKHQLGSGSVHTHQPVVQAPQPHPTPRHAHKTPPTPCWSAAIRNDTDGQRRARQHQQVREKKRGIHTQRWLLLRAYLSAEPPRDFRLQNDSLVQQCRVCAKTHIHNFTRLSSGLCSPL